MMRLQTILGVVCLCVAQILFAVEKLPANLLSLESREGAVLLQQDLHQNTTGLFAHFTTQQTVTYCGVASAVMVLNAMGVAAPVDPTYTPYTYFTQANFFNDKVSAIIPAKAVSKSGMTLSQLAHAMETYGVKATPFFANKMDIKAFRKMATQALSQDQYVTVNFLRTALGQQGGGHHSPLAAYDEKADRFLLLDVARYKYPAYWVKTDDLWNAINTMDGELSRGLIIISRQ